MLFKVDSNNMKMITGCATKKTLLSKHFDELHLGW
jgi:hypothetical protein